MLQAPLRKGKNPSDSKARGGSAQQGTEMKLPVMMDGESPVGYCWAGPESKRDEWPSVTRPHWSLWCEEQKPATLVLVVGRGWCTIASLHRAPKGVIVDVLEGWSWSRFFSSWDQNSAVPSCKGQVACLAALVKLVPEVIVSSVLCH